MKIIKNIYRRDAETQRFYYYLAMPLRLCAFAVEKRYLLALLLILFSFMSFAQQDKKLLRDGNKLYEAKKFTEADSLYRQALGTKQSTEGAFNLGDALFQQGKYDDAAQQFQSITSQDVDKETKAKAYHNLGNSLLQSKKYQESVDAYKNALRANPSDDDTKYNLAYAQKKLIQQQQQQQQQQQNQDKNKDQDKKDQQNKDDKNKDQKDQDKNDDQQADKDKKDDKKQGQQPKPDDISKQDADRMLDALNKDEQDLQKDLQKKKAKVAVVKIDKDW